MLAVITARVVEVGMRLLGKAVVRQVIMDELARVARRTDNTIDDRIVEVVRAGLLNQANPLKETMRNANK